MFLGRRTFELGDQLAFARRSGDVNPMHVDPVAARRLMAGRPVVHGMHTALTALELHAAAGGTRPPALRCDFRQPIAIGEDVIFERDHGDTGVPRLVARVGEQVCMALELDAADAPAPALDGGDPGPDLTNLDAPLDDEPAAWVGRSGQLALAGMNFDDAFPAACALLGAPAVRTLAGLSFMVGMACPGRHSMFSSFVLRPAPEVAGTGHVRIRVTRYDSRVRLFFVEFDGPLVGELRAFLRPPPQPQPAATALAGVVAPTEFAGTRSLVIGGSRGIGELCAKLLAAGGSDVTLTYAAGVDDAAAVVAEIADLGRGDARALRHVVGESPPAVLAAAGPWDAVLYFPTPRIAARAAGYFDAAQFGRYFEMYVERFEELCRALSARPGPRPTRVFYPSTVFVAERPRGFAEYAMAKAAAEVLIDDLNRGHRSLRIFSRRLPRLATDQTSALVPVRTASNVETMLPLLRELMQPDVA